MDKKPSFMKKAANAAVGQIGAILGGASVWFSLFFVFYFDTWLERLLAISAMVFVIWIIGKLVDKYYPQYN